MESPSQRMKPHHGSPVQMNDKLGLFSRLACLVNSRRLVQHFLTAGF